jgi:hypothetical protein
VKQHGYEIRIEEHLGDSWTDWFEGLTIQDEVDEQGQFAQTVLSGAMDPATLHGALMRIRDLGLTLISVSRETECKDWTGD